MDATIKNIIFDWGGVLLGLDMPKCMAEFEKAGVRNIRDYVAGYNGLDFFRKYETGDITTAEFRDGVRSMVGSDLTDEEIDRLWKSMLLDIPEEKLRLLMKLSENYRIYLLSNTNEMHWDYASAYVFDYNGYDVKQCFTQIFLSHELHLAKPDPEIYREVLKRAGLNAGETLFIDDSEENCKAAESVGLHAAHYIPGNDLSIIF